MKDLPNTIRFPEDADDDLKHDVAGLFEFLNQSDATDEFIRELGLKLTAPDRQQEQTVEALAQMRQYLFTIEQYRNLVAYLMIRRFKTAVLQVVKGEKPENPGKYNMMKDETEEQLVDAIFKLTEAFQLNDLKIEVVDETYAKFTRLMQETQVEIETFMRTFEYNDNVVRLPRNTFKIQQLLQKLNLYIQSREKQYD